MKFVKFLLTALLLLTALTKTTTAGEVEELLRFEEFLGRACDMIAESFPDAAMRHDELLDIAYAGIVRDGKSYAFYCDKGLIGGVVISIDEAEPTKKMYNRFLLEKVGKVLYMADLTIIAEAESGCGRIAALDTGAGSVNIYVLERYLYDKMVCTGDLSPIPVPGARKGFAA